MDPVPRSDWPNRHAFDSEDVSRALSDQLPAIVWVTGPTGAVEYISRAWTRLTGQLQIDALEHGWAEVVHPEDRDETLVAWQSAVASGETYEHELRIRTSDGGYRWQLERATPDRGADGSVRFWYGTTTDVDDRVRAATARQRFVDLVENSGELIAIAEVDGRLSFLNDAGRRLVGLRAENLAATTLFDLFADDGNTAKAVRAELQAHGRWNGETTFRRLDRDPGRAMPVEAHVFEMRDPVQQHVTAIALIAVDRRERRRSEERLETLVEASLALARTIDYARTLDNVVTFVAQRFASYALLDLADETGRIRRVAVAHGNPGSTVLVERLRPIDPPADRVATHPVARAVHEGVATLERIDADWIAAAAISPEHEAAMLDLEIRELLVVPVVAPSGVLGALTCALDMYATHEGYDAADIAFGEELGRRVGVAIENARRFERERRIASELQAASLPQRLPALPHFVLDAAYRPGSSEATIGGDWYDAFALSDGRLVVTIGDATGHGLQAAVIMTKLRGAMQAAAMTQPEPNAMLDVADRILRMHDPDAIATGLAAIFDPAAGTFEFASAGHPGPLVRSRDGTVHVHECPGTMLGLRETGSGRTMTIAVEPGTVVVFFTDGLVEMERDFEGGERRLRAAVEQPFMEEPQPARALVERIVGDGPAGDDIAVLVVSVVGMDVRAGANRNEGSRT